jgi:hypothetical protein
MKHDRLRPVSDKVPVLVTMFGGTQGEGLAHVVALKFYFDHVHDPCQAIEVLFSSGFPSVWLVASEAQDWQEKFEFPIDGAGGERIVSVDPTDHAFPRWDFQVIFGLLSARLAKHMLTSSTADYYKLWP